MKRHVLLENLNFFTKMENFTRRNSNMRNLKKILALALALVMSMSLVSIASATDFSDDADI